ncbi:MAG TPA: pyridoxamine 5'-phosphate oxidase family protein [Solirubrobacteraceae bacterium]
MGRTYEHITPQLREWVERQSLFFVATAPLAADGHVNVSPKGPIGSLRFLGPMRMAYLDVIGSGAETIAHIRENGRIVIMMCAFEGPPRIVRFHGRGEVVPSSDRRFETLLGEAAFEDPSLPPARRAVIDVEVTRVADSCGYGVPLMTFEGLREHHALSTGKKLRTMGADGYARYLADHNPASIDGLPALDAVE